MFSGSFFVQIKNPLKEDLNGSSEKKKVEDNDVQGYNYRWELTPFVAPYFTQSISEAKAGD